MSVRVLVVDDEPMMCELIEEVLRSAGMNASSASSSREAATLLQCEKFHAVFLDFRMPSPDGIELARQIRASGLNASSVIVMITGEEDTKMLGRAFQAGADFCLFKPIARSNLLRLIRVTQGSIERERRRFTRVRVRCRASLESGEERFEGTTLDLSLNGMLVQAPHAFPVKTPIRVSLELAPGTLPLCFAAPVVRTIGVDCMAFELKNLGPGESERLQQFLLPLILRTMGE